MKIRAYSGDLLNRQTKTNKRRHSFLGTPEDEILVGFSSAFDDLSISEDKEYVIRSKNEITADYPKTKCNNYPRCHELSVKLFIHEVTSDVVSRGMNDILVELGQDYVDSLILALDSSFTNKQVENIWKQAEKEKNLGRANLIGVADLTEEKLFYLCEWSSIVPDIHQISPINYDCCGSSVQSIMNVAQQYNIRTLSHGDPVGEPRKMTLDVNSLLDHTKKQWSTNYTARYVQRSKDRNIITKKGYAMEITEVL